MSDNKPVLTESNGIQNVSYQNRLLYKDDINLIINSLQTAPDTLFLVISPLLFKGINELQSFTGSSDNILLIENNSEFYNFSLNFAKQETVSLPYFYTDNSPLPKEIINYLNAGSFRRICPVYFNSAYFFERNYYKNLIKEMNSYIQRLWKNRLTMIHMGRLWSRNIFLNLPFLPDSRDISSITTNKNVLVAAAGESLEKSIEIIKNSRDSFFLIAVDTAIGPLLSNRITPDLCIVLEAQHANLSDFYYNEAFNIPAVFDLTSSPEVIRKHCGKKYFILSDYTDTSLINTLKAYRLCPPLIPPLGSVGIAALYLALKISTSEVFFTGLDFSFTPDKYHSNGSPTHKRSLLNWQRLAPPHYFDAVLAPNRHKCKDKSGRIVFTDPIMKSYSERITELEKIDKRLNDTGIYGLAVCSRQAVLSELPETGNSKKINIEDEKHINSDYNAAAIKTFLNNEREKLDSASREVVEYINGENKREDELIRLLKEIDYCYYYFPDYRNSPVLEKSFLKRFLVSSRWFSEYLKKITENM